MKKSHTFLHLVIIFLAIFSTTTGLTILTVRQQLLNDQMYIDAVDQSGIYSTVDTIAQEKVTEVVTNISNSLITVLEEKINEPKEDEGFVSSITTRGEEPAQPDFREMIVGNFETIIFSGLRTLVDTQSSKLVEQGFDNIQFEERLQSQVEQGITDDVAWIKGEKEDSELFSYIPTPREVEQVRDSSFTEIIGQLMGVNPAAKTELVASNSNSSQGQIAIANVATEVIDGVTAGVDEVVEKKAQESGLDEIFNGALDVVKELSIMKQQALQLRQWVASTQEVGYGLLIVGAIMTILAVIMTKTRRIKALFKVGLLSGLSMVVLAFIHYFMISNWVVLTLSVHTWPYFQSFLTPDLNIALLQNINYIMSYILHEVVTIMFWVGAVIASVSGMVLMIEWFFHRRGEDDGMDDEDIDFDLDEDGDDE